MKLHLDAIGLESDRVCRDAQDGEVQELANSMALIGQLHPIIVCREGLRWWLVCGVRRLQAARTLGWPTIWVRPFPYLRPAVRQLVRAAENLHRSSFTLADLIDIVVSLREDAIRASVVAKVLGRDPRWVEAVLALARDPVARALADAGRLTSVEAWQKFMLLAPATRKRLLNSDEPISSEQCTRAGNAGKVERHEIPGLTADVP